MKNVRFLFFDVEGANSFNFVNKMCTFGYVITDENFNINLKIDVVINPESFFDKHIIKENMNAYPIEKYENSPSFSYFYHSIKTILEFKQQIVAGWSIENDVKYVFDDCKRYKLPQIQYKFVDIQKIYMELFNLPTAPSLESACETLKIDRARLHKSDEDALLTMLVAKELCKKVNLSLPELVSKFKKCESSVKEYEKKAFTDKEIEEKIERRKAVYSISRYQTERKIHNRFVRTNYVYGFTSELLNTNPKLVNRLARYLKQCGANCSINYKEITHIICKDDEKTRRILAGQDNTIKKYRISKFINIIGFHEN